MATATVATYDEHIALRVTLDPSKAPEVIQDLIAAQGPDAVESAARGSLLDVLDDALSLANAGGAGFLTVERLDDQEHNDGVRTSFDAASQI